MSVMKLLIAFFVVYLTTHDGDAKGLTMITRGCLANYLRQNQLLSVSFKIGPVPKPSLCESVIKNTLKSVIDAAVKAKTKSEAEVADYKECFGNLIEKNNMTDLLLKKFMYEEESLENSSQLGLVANQIFELFDYLCHKSKLQDDFNKTFTSSFPGYEKETNRYCLVNLLQQQQVIDQDFNVYFEIPNTASPKCPEYINEGILDVKTEAFDFIHQTDFYRNETIWECAADERLRIGYVRAYYRLMAYTFSNESDERKSDERQRFLNVLYAANEAASKCFKIGYESL